MAVVPTLATMAALTMFHTTGYADGSVDDYWEPYAAPATRIQRTIRSYFVRVRALLGELVVNRTLHLFTARPFKIHALVHEQASWQHSRVGRKGHARARSEDKV